MQQRQQRECRIASTPSEILQAHYWDTDLAQERDRTLVLQKGFYPFSNMWAKKQVLMQKVEALSHTSVAARLTQRIDSHFCLALAFGVDH